MSAKALEILKSKMSLKERRQFVANCKNQNPGWEKKINGMSLKVLNFNIGAIAIRFGFFSHTASFNWMDSKEGDDYWHIIYKRFTEEELSTKINLKEL